MTTSTPSTTSTSHAGEPGSATAATPAGSTGAATLAGHAARWQVLGVLALVVGVAAYWLTHSGLTDDGYITLDYARTLATTGTWGMQGGLEANTATSPANVLVLAVLMLIIKTVTGDTHPVVALGLLTVGAAVATGAWWSAASRRLGIGTGAAAIGLVLVLVSPLLLSVVGLETAMLVALLVGLLAEAVRGRPVAFGLIAGATVLTRLDSAVFVLVIALASTAIRRRWWRALLPLLVVTLPWFITSWYVLGSAIPDTLAIKQQQTFPGDYDYLSGLWLFLQTNTAPTLVAFVPAVLGLLVLLCWLAFVRRGPLGPLVLFGGAGLVYFAVYCVLGVGPYNWYYVPTAATLTLLFTAALDPVVARLRPAGRRPALAAVGVLLLGGTIVPDLLFGHGLPWRAPPLYGNYAMPADYLRVGADLRTRLGNDGMLAPGEIGGLMFACDCKILDQFSDRGTTIPFLRHQVALAPEGTKWLWRLNFRHLDWSQKPTPRRYRMEWHPGWVSPRPDMWNVSSPAPLIGRGHFVLLPIDAPRTPVRYP